MVGLTLGQAVFEKTYVLTTQIGVARLLSRMAARHNVADDADAVGETSNTYELIELLETSCKHALAHEGIEIDHNARFVCVGVQLTENQPILPGATVALHGHLSRIDGASRQFHIDVWSHGRRSASAVVNMIKSDAPGAKASYDGTPRPRPPEES